MLFFLVYRKSKLSGVPRIPLNRIRPCEMSPVSCSKYDSPRLNPDSRHISNRSAGMVGELHRHDERGTFLSRAQISNCYAL